jgi:hypothetical protein
MGVGSRWTGFGTPRRERRSGTNSPLSGRPTITRPGFADADHIRSIGDVSYECSLFLDYHRTRQVQQLAIPVWDMASMACLVAITISVLCQPRRSVSARSAFSDPAELQLIIKLDRKSDRPHSAHSGPLASRWWASAHDATRRSRAPIKNPTPTARTQSAISSILRCCGHEGGSSLSLATPMP